VIGSKTLASASDYPHGDMSRPESATLLWDRTDISLETKKNLVLHSAKGFYNI